MSSRGNFDPAMPNGSLGKSAGQKPTIIVAEDDGFLRALICELLEAHGYNVISFSGGDAALVAANQMNAEILITDIIMDAGEGISTIAETRKVAKNMKILAVSSNAKYLVYAHRIGADCIMQKPLNSQELLENISKLHTMEPALLN